MRAYPKSVVRPKLMFKDDPGKTHQSFAADCDINNILKKAARAGGVLPELIKSNPRYGDFSDGRSYQESLDLVMRAQEQFAALSSGVRARFHNDPRQFLEFCENPANAQELVKLGLATEKEVPPSEPPVSAPKAKSGAPKGTPKEPEGSKEPAG